MHQSTAKIPISVDGIPCPFHYSTFFSTLASQPHDVWDSFQDFKEIKPGDLIVYLPRNYIPKAFADVEEGRSPGTHIMVVEEVLKEGENFIQIVIIDSSRFRHCSEDSRTAGGIGRAPLTIYSEQGKTILQWGARRKRWEKDLFFGRLRTH